MQEPTSSEPDTALIDADVHVESFRQAREARRLELVEDYVELIADLIGDGGEARQVDIAARLGVAQPTVAKMLKRLAEDGLVQQRALSRRIPDRSRARHSPSRAASATASSSSSSARWASAPRSRAATPRASNTMSAPRRWRRSGCLRRAGSEAQSLSVQARGGLRASSECSGHRLAIRDDVDLDLQLLRPGARTDRRRSARRRRSRGRAPRRCGRRTADGVGRVEADPAAPPHQTETQAWVASAPAQARPARRRDGAQVAADIGGRQAQAAQARDHDVGEVLADAAPRARRPRPAGCARRWPWNHS